MPTSIITSPDGQKYRVTHPEGASQDEIMARVAAQSSDQPTEQMDPAAQRESIAGGSLSFGPFDTGIPTPQWLDEGLAGMGRRFAEIGTLGLHETPPEAARLLDDSGYATAGGIAADVGALAAGGSALRGVGTLSKAPQFLSNPNLASVVAGNAAYGAATSNDRLGGALGAGGGAGLGYGVTKGVGKVVAPRIQSAARSLMDDGVQLTPGEMLGGALKRVEDASTVLPLAGDAIKNAQRRSLEQYNRRTIDGALDPIGKSLSGKSVAGREAIGEAHDLISKQYDEILSDMTVSLDDQFLGEIQSLKRMAATLPKRERRKFSSVIDEKLLRPFDNPNKLLLGETFKEVDSGLRGLYKKAQKSSDVYQNDLGDALRSAHTSLRDMAKRQNPVRGAQLDQAEKSYARMSRVDEASGFLGAESGVFTPANMLNRVKANTSKRQFAQGSGFGQKEAEAAKGVLAQTIPSSGTTERALLNAGTFGGLGMWSPTALGGLLLGAGAYTRPGVAAMQKAIGSRPEMAVPLRGMLEKSAPFVGILGSGAGIAAN